MVTISPMTAGRGDYELSDGPIPALRWPLLDRTGVVDAVVTTRRGGISTGVYNSLNLGLHVGDDPEAVIENRARAGRMIGLELDDLVFCQQTHGDRVALVGVGDRGRGTLAESDALLATDALVTAEAGVGLVIMVADCVPIVLLDPVARVLGCVHAGWRGATARIVATAIDRMEAVGADRSRVLAGLGPAIPGDRYQVGDDVVAAVNGSFGERAGEVVCPDGTGRWLFDGWQANRLVLEDSGVASQNVAVAAVPTGDGVFFSDRAERPCGRFALIAKLRD